jgi:purine-binding chemotaxis protein CheW
MERIVMASEINIDSFTERQLVTFLLGEDEFGADIMDVKEIIRVPDITKIPNAPSYVEGACNLRGNVLSIVDGRTRFHLDRKEKDENSRVLVIDVEGKATGVVVDKVSEVMRVKTSDIEEAPQIVKNVESDYLKGVVKLESGNRLIMLLDIVKALKIHNSISNQDNEDDMSSWNQKSNINRSTNTSIQEEQLVTFLLDKAEYAIKIMQVKEIIRVPQIVKVPNCESYLDGVVSIRNNLLPMINLRAYFGMERLENNDQMRILVVDMGTFTAGIIVDRVSEVLRVPTNVIQPPPKFSTDNVEQLVGVAKLKNGCRMILILDPTKLISAEEISSFNDIHEAEDTVSEDDAITSQVDEDKLVIFRLGIEEYGIKIAHVQEINRMTEVTKIPRAPYYIEGIVNLRGNVIPALDLRKLFQLSEKQVTDATRIIIVNLDEKRTGIIVDSVSEVLNIDKRQIEAAPDILSSGVDSDYVEGVGKLDAGKRMIMILDLYKILQFS